MDGDGSGRGTHLSFLTLTREEYDEVLLTLTALDEYKQKDISSNPLGQIPPSDHLFCLGTLCLPSVGNSKR